jgi:DNA-binding beta-propeller fold protein YncE
MISVIPTAPVIPSVARNLLFLALSAPALLAQSSPTMEPTNGSPNPYQTIKDWAKMPQGRTWGSTSAVAIDKDGTSIWVAERCGVNNCVGSTLDPVLKFDANGNLMKSFGSGMIQSPHGIWVDKENNVWIVDCSCTLGGGRRGGAPATAAPEGGHQIYKFSPEGKLLMTLGTSGGGRGADFFWQPNAVLVAPDGSIFVAEGHSSQNNPSARVYKFSKDGKLLKTWGQWGSGPDDFDQPHTLAMDSRGRLFVGDRGNNRVKIFDQEGKLLDTWYQFSRPSGIFIDGKDNIYVADSESGSVNDAHRAWKRGIRIGSATDGIVRFFIPDPWPTCQQAQQSSAESPCATNTSSAEGLAVDSHGVVYGAEVGQRALKRYQKN